VATRRSSSLKPQLNQIRAWVQEGATDIWIAHKLGTTPTALARFRKQHDLLRENERPPEPPPAPEPPEAPAADAAATPDEPRPRSRRGGRGRGKKADDAPIELEGVFDHGDEGYGLWLDGAVRDAGVYRAHWQGHADVVVRIEPDTIVIRRR
jgi:hypothetical protein